MFWKNGQESEAILYIARMSSFLFDCIALTLQACRIGAVEIIRILCNRCFLLLGLFLLGLSLLPFLAPGFHPTCHCTGSCTGSRTFACVIVGNFPSHGPDCCAPGRSFYARTRRPLALGWRSFSSWLRLRGICASFIYSPFKAAVLVICHLLLALSLGRKYDKFLRQQRNNQQRL
jgi:hypothetical protein